MATKKSLYVVFTVLLVALVLFSINLKGNNLFKEQIQYTVSQSDRPSYTNLDDIKKASDAVFIGTVDSIAGTRNLARDPKDPSKEDENITVEGVDYKVTVLEYLKGSTTYTRLKASHFFLQDTYWDPNKINLQDLYN